MKTWLMNGMTALLALCAVVVTGLVARRELFPAAGSDDRPVAEWREYAKSGERMGPAEAPVTIVAFSDFQCPACARLAAGLRTVRAEHPGRVNVVFRHFPLPNHAYAVPAARASECAAAQGRFEAFHDALFSQQDSIGIKPWQRFAAAAQVPDTAAFGRCLGDPSVDAIIRRDTDAGAALEVVATPTLLVNGRRVQGAPPPERLDRMVRDAMRGR